LNILNTTFFDESDWCCSDDWDILNSQEKLDLIIMAIEDDFGDDIVWYNIDVINLDEI
jgi:hypothetical protein